MAYSSDPDKSIVPAKIRQRILTMAGAEKVVITFATEKQATNMFQAIRAFLKGHDKKVPKSEQISASIIISRECTTLTIRKRDLGILAMEL